MANLNNIPVHIPKEVPFIQTEDLVITTLRKYNKITGWHVVYKGVTKTFHVDKKHDIEKCFKELEKFIK